MKYEPITATEIIELSDKAARDNRAFMEFQKDLEKNIFEAFGLRITKWNHEKAGLIDSQGKLLQLMEVKG